MGQQDIELEPEAFREVPTKSLARPADLWKGAVLFGIGTLLSAFAADQIGGFWAALIPIPGAIWFGICIAGLFPRFFFGRTD